MFLCKVYPTLILTLAIYVRVRARMLHTTAGASFEDDFTPKGTTVVYGYTV